MRVRRSYRILFLSGIAVLLLGIFFIHQYTNVFDFYFYVISPRNNAMPLSFHCNGGRLGNQMCSYATLYGLSKLNRRRFVVQDCNAEHLRDVFVGPSRAHSIHHSRYIRWNTYDVIPYLRTEDAEIPVYSNFLSGYPHACSFTFFDHDRKGIQREFQFQEHLKKHALDVLRKANIHHLRNVTYVSLHVRRGDYKKGWLDAFEGVPVNMEYFRKAVKYFRDKYENVLFIALSEDRQWCIEKLSAEFGVYVPEEAPSPAHDLAVLASCNHSILTYGTFGFWGAYLAGGEVLYFDKFLKPNTTFTTTEFVFEKMYPPQWKGIVTLNSSYWFNKTETTNSSNESRQGNES